MRCVKEVYPRLEHSKNVIATACGFQLATNRQKYTSQFTKTTAPQCQTFRKLEPCCAIPQQCADQKWVVLALSTDNKVKRAAKVSGLALSTSNNAKRW